MANLVFNRLQVLDGDTDKGSIILRELYEHGMQGFLPFPKVWENSKLFTHVPWHKWCLANWGTKWDMYEERELHEYELKFMTANNSIEPFVTKLREMFPDVYWELEYRCEFDGDSTIIRY